MSSREKKALDDLRVLEVTNENGQHCGKLLADMGAEVIKVEPPCGEAARRIGPFYKDIPDPNRSLFFWHYNTSKKSVTLNLDTPDGQRLFRDLAKSADIVLESMPPGHMPARRLGYDQVRELNPRVVYCSITPYGQDGPWAHYKATELTLMASGGQMGVCGYSPEDDDDQSPVAPGGGNVWHMAAHNAYIAIMAAIFARDMRGIGQYIDLSMQEASAVCTEGAFSDFIYMGGERKRQTGRHAGISPSGPGQWLCGDGRYFNAMMARVKIEEWLALVEWLSADGMQEDLDDVKYLEPVELQRSMPHVLDVIGRFAKTKTAEYMFHEGQKRKFAWTMVRAPSDLPEDPHLRERGFFVEVDHPELGEKFTYPGAPFIFHGTPWEISHRAPLIGEHNAAILRDELGLTQDRIAALREMGVV